MVELLAAAISDIDTIKYYYFFFYDHSYMR